MSKNGRFIKGNIPWNKGIPCSQKTKNKIRNSNIGKTHSLSSRKKMSKSKMNHFVSKETRQKLSIAKSGKNHHFYGKHLPVNIRRKMSKARIGFYPSEITRKKLSIALTGRRLSEQTKEKIRRANIGIKHSKERRKKMRLSRLKYISIAKNNGEQIYPVIGKNEVKILNYIEKQDNINIIRQYKIDGYFIDGYCKETNTAYEIDELYHHNKKQKEKDIEREEYLKEKLNCIFIRLNEKDYLRKMEML